MMEEHTPSPPGLMAFSLICVFISIVLSFHLIWQHLKHYRKPDQQRNIIRILLMVPIYSAFAALTMQFPQEDVVFSSLRSIYEAFVIYSFYSLLLYYLGPDKTSRKETLSSKKEGNYPFPACGLKYNPRSEKFLITCTRGTLQYVLIHPIVSILFILVVRTGLDKRVDGYHPSVLLVIIDMISVTLAMFFLVHFYIVVKNDIERYRPLLKFFAVKFVVFFSFWQDILLAILESTGGLSTSRDISSHSLRIQIHNTLICVEMLIASIIHLYCFSAVEYDTHETKFSDGFTDALNPVDIVMDTKTVILSMPNSKNLKPEDIPINETYKKSPSKKSGNPNEHDVNKAESPLMTREAPKDGADISEMKNKLDKSSN